MIVKTAIIKKLKSGKYRLYSKKRGPDGERKNLGTFDSRSAAEEHEKDVNFFKSHADDGKYDRQTRMLSDLSNIAGYLEEAGFVDKADQIYDVMNAIDGMEQNIVDPYPVPENQMNTANQGHEPGESPISGAYSGLSTPEAQLNDDRSGTYIVSGVNGIMGNTSINDQNAGMFQGFSDSYFYTGYGELEGPYR